MGLSFFSLATCTLISAETRWSVSRPILQEIEYDLCVLTGDYRGETFGPYDETIAGMARICAALKKPIYGVLGNHDTVRMLPGS